MVAMMEGGGGTTLSEIYQNSQRLKRRVRSGIEKLEQLEFTPELSYSINKDIDQIPWNVSLDLSLPNLNAIYGTDKTKQSRFHTMVWAGERAALLMRGWVFSVLMEEP
ncbi:hypothetical protein IFM89_015034 [Coptis chinensis]|uniref:Uncharacterized protein n=1 Tax=Coptis chinensis TaxID=261450 RepID=A0A835HKA9_9MAGN|nr:hypothetical protein IFM89_015034 [Coptis chinensis]